MHNNRDSEKLKRLSLKNHNKLMGNSQEDDSKVNIAGATAISKITRAEIVLMIQRVYEYKTGMEHTASKAPYTNFGSYNKETVDAISLLYELDLVTGSNVKFNLGNPTKSCKCDKNTCGITVKCRLNEQSKYIP